MLSRSCVRVQFDNTSYLFSETKLLLSGEIESSSGPAEIPNPHTYGRGFMCALSTFFIGFPQFSLAMVVPQK